MHVLRGTLVALMAAVFPWIMPSNAQADPITVTGGVIAAYFPSEFINVAVLTGENFSIAGAGGAQPTFGSLQVGSTGTLGGSAVFNSGQLFPTTVNGTTYSETIVVAGLSLIGAPFVVPPPTNGGGTFVTPFTMTGHAQGFGAAADHPLLFDVDLIGTGTAVAQVVFIQGVGYIPTNSNITFTFSNAAATPEPGSLLLLSSGIVGLMVRARKRRC